MMKHLYSGVESLEDRRLLSASIDGKGGLRVVGTGDADVISIRQRASRLVVAINGDKRSFDVDDVERVRVASHDGDDRVRLFNVRLNSVIDGGSGDDRLLGSRGRDRIKGGSGDDVISGGFKRDILTGESGDDTIRGGSGNDDIDGDEDRDRLFGNAGNDVLDANDDRWEDDLIGGPGFDIGEVDDNFAIEDDVVGVEDVDD